MSSEAWAALGITDVEELHGGKQARVFAGRRHGLRLVLKLLAARDADRSALAARLDMLGALAASDRHVCAPVPLDGRLVNEVVIGDDPVLAVAYEFVEGREPDLDRAADVVEMGRTLADLHTALARLPAYELPVVAALRARADLTLAPTSRTQLLHGDFSAENVRITAAAMRVFDFDDCGYGPVEFDVANALYVVLFSATVDGPPGRYGSFRSSFLRGYDERSDRKIDDTTVESLITARVIALATWVDDLATAPIGIRNSSKEWIATLRSFTASYLDTPR